MKQCNIICTIVWHNTDTFTKKILEFNGRTKVNMNNFIYDQFPLPLNFGQKCGPRPEITIE